MIALEFAENREDVENPAFSEFLFGAKFFCVGKFDAEFDFYVDIRFEVGTGKVPDLAYV